MEAEGIKEKYMSRDEIKLMDLPEPVLLKIMSYLSHDILRHTVFRVSMEWKRLAHSKVLWLQACLAFEWLNQDKSSHFKKKKKKFVRDILLTPYLHKLIVTIGEEIESIRVTSVLKALLSTKCRVHSFEVSLLHGYKPEPLLFLLQHPELRKLKISASALSGDFNELNPFESTPYMPVGPKPQDPQGILDLRNVEKDDCETVERVQPQGLLYLEVSSFSDYDGLLNMSAIARNLSTLLLAHKHTLRGVFWVFSKEAFAQASLGFQRFYMALAECTKLESLSLTCDPTGSVFCAMLQAMQQSTLRHLFLSVPATVDAQGVARVFQLLCCHAPRLEDLDLRGSQDEPTMNFPGFRPLKDLLVGREGCAGLRKMLIRNMAPVGRTQLLELASIARASARGELSLRLLGWFFCLCSEDGSWDECRCHAEAALQAAAPSLELWGPSHPPDSAWTKCQRPCIPLGCAS